MTEQWTDCTPVNYRIYVEQTDGNGHYRWREKNQTEWKPGRSPGEESPSDVPYR